MQIYGEADWIYFNMPDDKYSTPGEFKVTLKVPKAKAGVLIKDINEETNDVLQLGAITTYNRGANGKGILSAIALQQGSIRCH